MKLLFAIKALGAGVGGGAERILATIATALSERGHEVSVVTYDPPDAQDFYRVGAKVRRIRLGQPVSMAPRQILRLRKVASGERPDVAVGFMHSSFVPLAWALAGTGTPVVASERTSYSHYRLHPLQGALVHLTAPLFARMTANAEGVRLGFPPAIRARMDVVPNPVAPVETFADPVGAAAKTLLSIGGLRPEKDHETLVRAFASIAPAHPEWTLRIVGHGALEDRLIGLARSLGRSHQVEFARSVQSVEEEYAKAQLFVLPSRYEAFPNCLAEALAHGLPAVGFADCPGTNELIAHDVNGILVAGNNRVSALAATLDDLMGSSQKRLILGRAAGRSVERYSLESVVDQWEALLQRVAKPAHPAADMTNGS